MRNQDLYSPTLTSTQKRPRSVEDDADEMAPSSIHIPGEDTGDIHFDLNCNQIRNRINAFLNSGETKITHFQRELRINSNSYGRFMKLKGPWSGTDNQTMEAAYLFFKKRELAGVKIPKKKAKMGDSNLAQYDVSGIHLDGEDEEAVPVYDSCNDVRPKVNAHLRESPMTQAAFLREICKTFPEGKNIQSVQHKRFMTRSGALDGQESPVYYGAYVYFEKMRVRDNGKKSNKRLEMEQHWPLGVPRDARSARQAVWAYQTDTVTRDSTGRLQVHRGIR